MMNPIAAQESLSEIALLASLDQAAENGVPLSDVAAPSFSVGQLTSGQVIANRGDASLVRIDGQSYALRLPTQPPPGQTIDLQVLRVAPELQFRLVTDSDSPPAAGTLVDLGRTEGGPDAPMSEGPDTIPQAAAVAPNVTVQSTNSGLGASLATHLQEQFEAPLTATDPSSPLPSQPRGANPMPGPVVKGDNQAPVAGHSIGDAAPAAPGTGTPVRMEQASGPEALPVLPSLMARMIEPGPARAPLPTGTATDAAAPNASAAATTPVDVPRANATASTLNPAAWHGQVWQGQNAEVVIEPDRRRIAFEAPSLNAWHATLKLTLPHLGTVNAQVYWSTTGVRIAIEASEARSATTLQEGSGAFLETLRSLDMRVQSIGVRHG